MLGGRVRCAAAFAALFGLTGTGAFALGEKAAADLKDKSGNPVGRIEFVEASGGVLIKVKLKGLPPGPHGLRIHDTGNCEGDFASAGEVYNPLGAKYGFLNEDGPMAGELPNIYVGGNGELEAELLNQFIALGKEAEEPLLDGDGASILVFEKAGDHISEPEGNAGSKIACGVIAPTK
jgi:Cu/Zn superoxide dismutase